MIYHHTYLKVTDNSGALIAQCIKTLRNTSKAKVGDIIIVVLKKIIPKKKVKKGEIHRALVIRTKQQYSRYSGAYIKFAENSIILLNKKNLPIGTRIFGPVYKELRYKKFMKIISLASIAI